MKKRNLTLTLTAALLTLVTTAAYSQTEPLTAQIPFAFRAGGSDLSAGRYMVGRALGPSGGAQTMELRNMDTGKAVFLPSKSPSKESKDARPRLVFQCVDEEGCALTSLWSGAGNGLEFPVQALTAAQRERRETIYLSKGK